MKIVIISSILYISALMFIITKYMPNDIDDPFCIDDEIFEAIEKVENNAKTNEKTK